MVKNIWEERIIKDDGSKEPKKAFMYFQEYLNLVLVKVLGKYRKILEKAIDIFKDYFIFGIGLKGLKLMICG